MFRTYQVLFNRLLVALDGLIVITSFLCAWYIKFHSGWLAHGGHLPLRAYGPAILAGIPVFVAANGLAGLYRPMRAKSIWSEAYAIGKSAVIGLLVFMSVLYFVKMADFSRDVLTLFTACFVSLTLAERLTLRAGLRAMRARGFNQKFILIVGWNQAAERFVRTLEQQPWFGYRMLGYLSDPAGDRADKPGVPCIGTRGHLADVLRQHLVDQVVIALPRGEFSAIGQVIQHCEAAGIQSLILPDYFDLLPARPRFETFGDIPLIDTRYVPLDDAMNAALKRAFDIGFSLLVLIGLSPLFLAIAIGVKLSSPGPILYVQERVGKNRRVFKMYKFRTMYWNGRSGSATAQTASASPSGAGGTEERVGDTGDETAGATF
ncbi:MAG: sugar transferase, partial [Alicyclobacillus sp.]|nr:sugar transferase [Alicyclobacillus sp.]